MQVAFAHIESCTSLSFCCLGSSLPLWPCVPAVTMPAMCCFCVRSGNAVTGRLGSLPAGIWQLDVSDNSLSGPLPPLADLNDLEVLLTSNNRMQGPLPGKQPCSQGGLLVGTRTLQYLSFSASCCCCKI